MNDTIEDKKEIVNAVPQFARKKRNCLLFLLVWAVGIGVTYAMAPVSAETPITVLDMVVLVFGLILWTLFDAAEHNVRLWRHFGIMLVICPGPIIVMPIYFIRSRGWAGGLIACGKVIAFVVLLQGIYFGTALLVVALTLE